MKISYKYKLLGYFVFIFFLFTISIIVLQRKEEEKYRIERLQSQLNNYAQLVHNYFLNRNIQPKQSKLKELEIAHILPSDIRLSIISKSGNVLFDRDFTEDLEKMENHLDRPEIKSASYKGSGWNIRQSSSVHKAFFYFARNYKDYYIRIALQYTDQTKDLLQANNYFLYIVLIIFITTLIFLYLISHQFGYSINKLKDFSISVRNGEDSSAKIIFPNDEVGDIAKELVLIFKEQEKTNKALEDEKDKMIQHLKYATEGLAIFDPKDIKIYANTHFYQIINLISDKATLTTDNILQLPEFTPLENFLHSTEKKDKFKSIQIHKNGKYFHLSLCIFEDKSYEIRLRNITKMEKTRILKQEITSNIAHELRTPTTCLRAFLETLNKNHKISDEQRKSFIEKAYKQSKRLTQLIEDVSLLSNLSEYPEHYTFEQVDLKELLNTIHGEFQGLLFEQNISFNSLDQSVQVFGNKSLLHSVFSNLVDNTIKYAGKGTSINIKLLKNKEKHVYLSFYDTGSGIEEEHLNRIFERFYRTNNGRTRNTGGSGLGLSIVYNIIQIHKGDIQVKNHIDGGLEYQICLKE